MTDFRLAIFDWQFAIGDRPLERGRLVRAFILVAAAVKRRADPFAGLRPQKAARLYAPAGRDFDLGNRSVQ